jgi:hypothetical protein
VVHRNFHFLGNKAYGVNSGWRDSLPAHGCPCGSVVGLAGTIAEAFESLCRLYDLDHAPVVGL